MQYTKLKVPFSNSTINRCIDDMSHDAEEVLCDKLKNKLLYPGL
jgi:hypothetical protein